MIHTVTEGYAVAVVLSYVQVVSVCLSHVDEERKAVRWFYHRIFLLMMANRRVSLGEAAMFRVVPFTNS